MSCQTSTWASQSGPAPIPIVGIVELLGDLGGGRRGHHLQHDRERAGRLQRLPGVDQRAARRLAPALDAVAAEGVLGCGVKPMCAITGMPAPVMRLDLRRDPRAALELDRVRAGPPS